MTVTLTSQPKPSLHSSQHACRSATTSHVHHAQRNILNAPVPPPLTVGESPENPYWRSDDAETTLLTHAQRTASVRLGPVGPPPPPPHWVGQHTLAMEAEGVLSAEQLDVMDESGHWAHQDTPPPPHEDRRHMTNIGRRLLRHASKAKTSGSSPQSHSLRPAPSWPVHPAPLEYRLSRINAPMLKGFEDVLRDAPSPPPSMPPAPYAYRVGGSGIGGYKTLKLKDDGETLTSLPLVVGPNSLFITVRTVPSLRRSSAMPCATQVISQTDTSIHLHRTRR